MYRALIALLAASLYAIPAIAAPVVVWLEPDLPEEKYLRRAENAAGGDAIHLSHVDLAFPPQPYNDADDDKVEALRAEVIEATAVWDQFDVEFGIATSMEVILSQIEVARDRRDLDEVVDALLVQGAAVSRAFPPTEFQESDAAEPFRATVPGARVNRPWLVAMALAPDRNFTRADLVDGGPWPDFKQLREQLGGLPPGYLDISDLPRGAVVVVDGKVVERGTRETPLRPGTHFLHVIRNDVISGRQRLEIEAGLSADVPMLVDIAMLGAANAALVAGSTEGFPDSVKQSLEAITAYHTGQLYLAALDGGRLVIQPYSGESIRRKKRVVTVLGTGEIGGGVVVSPLFDGSNGDTTSAPAAHGGLGLEIGIFNGVILGGFDLAFTPGNTVTHGNRDETENVSTSVLPQAWGGIGVYVLRPSEIRTTLLLALTYGWNGPAHKALGGRLTLGVPIDEGGTWFRLTVGGSSASKSLWDTGNDETPMHTLFFRLGFGTRF
jgi:hypothetical protein